MKKNIHIFILPLFIFGLITILFFTPKREIGVCVKVLSPFFSFIKILLNCDSPSIINQATENYNELFSNRNLWGSRPVYIIAIKFLSSVILPFIKVLWIIIGDILITNLNYFFDITESELLKIQKYLSGFIAAILINFFIIFITLISIFHIFSIKGINKYAITFVVLTSDLVVGWFWVPHMVLINLFVPFGTILFYKIGLNLKNFSWPSLIFLALFGSLFSLSYGYCIIWLASFITGYLPYFFYKDNYNKYEYFKTITPKLILVVLVFILPILIWFSTFLISETYFSNEISKYSQFVWIIESYNNENFIKGILINCIAIFQSILNSFQLLGIMIFLFFCVILMLSLKQKNNLNIDYHLVIIPGIIAMIYILFFNFFQGYFQPRFLITIVLLLTLMTSHILEYLSNAKINSFFLYLIGIVQLILNFLSPAISQT